MTFPDQPTPELSSSPPQPALVAGRISPGARARLERILGAAEVDRDPRLKIICGCLLLFFFMTFSDWHGAAVPLSTAGNEVFNYAPSPLLENFRGLVFMDLFQTRTWFYAQGMCALFGLFSLFLLRSSVPALCLLAWLFLNKLFFYLADFRLFTNFHHFHLFYTLVFLVAPDKLRWFRLALVLSYLLSGLVKLTPSWMFGEYFNSLPDKLPLLPKVDWVVTAASVGVIVLELLGPLCWFTRAQWLRRLSFGAFLVFHLYSGVIVGFWYTSLMLPLVVAAFLGFNEPLHAGWRFARRQAAVIGVFLVALAGGVWNYFIPGDSRLTGEGTYTGLFMFDANHAVKFQVNIRKGENLWVFQVHRNWRFPGEPIRDAEIVCARFKNGEPVGNFRVTAPVRDGGEVIFNPRYFTDARMRISGDPYLYYFYARELQRRYQPDQLSLRLDRSLDGRDDYTTVLRITDFAALAPEYRLLRRNDWILLPVPRP